MIGMSKLIAISLLICSGCATVGAYEDYTFSMIDKSEEHLVGSFGVPQRTMSLEGSKVYEYLDAHGANASFSSGPMGTYGSTFSPWCKTTFQIKNGKVTHAAYIGNNCKLR